MKRIKGNCGKNAVASNQINAIANLKRERERERESERK